MRWIRLGEGREFLGAVQTGTTDQQGNVPFTFTVPRTLAASDVVTATATAPDVSTSEFSSCASVTVSKSSPAIATQVRRTSGGSDVTDGAAVPSGTSVYDTSTLTGSASGGGTATVSYYYAGPLSATQDAALLCNGSSGTKVGSDVTVTASGTVPNSANVTLSTAGTYQFWAIYSGNDYNNAATSTCRSETVIVSINLGAKTIGFWQNKNGQRIITNGCAGTSGTSLYGYLTQFNPFKDLTATSCSGIATYVSNVIKNATSAGSSMNRMLKAQMLSTALSVYFSAPSLGGNAIGAPAPIGDVTVGLTRICHIIDATDGTATCSGTYRNASAAFGDATSMTVS